MTLLSKVLASLSTLPKWFLTMQRLQESSHIQEKSILKPPEDIEVGTEDRDCEVSSAEMEIFPEHPTPPAGVKLQPLFPITTSLYG